MKKKNELAIFEEFRLKSKVKSKIVKTPKSLEKLILFCEVDKNKKPTKYYRKEKDETFVEVDEFGLYKSSTKQPAKRLYGIDTNFYIIRNMFKVPVQWWIKEGNDRFKLIKSNIKEEEEFNGIEFEIKSYVRDEAIKELSLEMKKMKKKAYEYKTEELKKLIEEKESKIIKNFGWKAIRTAALASLGLGFI